ncbi:hypothetical protein Hrd1104_11000 [Halorhabdus sp. CBA1104]|uniref:DUF5518 domain-containing protein n=1 Tax=Halorhabdus sp. CBA1104 TaxID=1380432 RepID=UPI0012B3D3A4|nr:DUF5518 domain-containing protein [Halorhabdus sp. CBA1104]QGN07773.1 hypothetical protein Hrd1104_11000 [Halorhabdus sp. CBA1104]
MASTDRSARTGPEPTPAFDRPLDWAIGAVLGVFGLLVALGGAALRAAIERPDIATLLRDSEFRSDVLTEAEAIDTLVALGEWGGLGLVVAGVSIALLGIAVVVAHGRARRDGRPTPRWILGVVGAIVNTVLSFVPLSPILGGAAASYLSTDRDSGVATGIFAGLFTIVPALLVVVFVGVGLFTGLPGPSAAAAVAVVVVAGLFGIAYVVGLSALGGYIGRRSNA